MKKIISLLLSVLLLVSLASCTLPENKEIIRIGDEVLDNDIYAYYLDVAKGTVTGSAEAEKEALDLCRQYCAVEKLFKEGNLTLSAADKAEIANDVNNYMVRFKNHYDSVGVKRETLTKIFTGNKHADVLFEFRYDKGTDDEAAEQKIQNYFYDNFVSFSDVCAYFENNGEKVSEKEKIAIKEDFASFAIPYSEDAVKAEEVFNALTLEKGYYVSGTVLLKKDSDGYPGGFFEKVYLQSPGTAQVLEYDECIFAVFKNDLRQSGDSLYASYRSSCIKDIYTDSWNEYIEDYAEKLSVTKE